MRIEDARLLRHIWDKYESFDKLANFPTAQLLIEYPELSIRVHKLEKQKRKISELLERVENEAS